MNPPAIIVSAWNRPAPLERLLKSLAEANYAGHFVNLVISIDADGGAETLTVAEDFQWRFGKKEIRIAEKHLGLKEHILRCGDFAAEFESIILLEDDLLVSPAFYSFILSASSFFVSRPDIAGISIYRYEISESGFIPFQPLEDGFDNWFMQHPSSWGFWVNAGQWKLFREFLRNNPEILDSEQIPSHIRKFSEQSWKKHFAHFLIKKRLFMVFPRISLSTNFEDPGTHASTRNLFQVALLMGNKDFKFSLPEETLAVYDSDFQILPCKLKTAVPILAAYDFECDFYGQKENYTKPYVITTRKGKQPIFSWGLTMQPDVANLIQGIPGNDISLYKKENVSLAPISEEIIFYRYGSLHRQMYVTAFNEWKDKFTLNSGPAIFHEIREKYRTQLEKYLEFSILIPLFPGKKSDLTETLKNLAQIAYPFLKILVVHQKGEDLNGIPKMDNIQFVTTDPGKSFLEAGISHVSGDLVIIAWPGAIFPKGSLHEVSKIFKKFPHIQWLNGIDSNSANNPVPAPAFSGSNFRFDLYGFQRRFSHSGKSFFPGSFIARKIMWDQYEGLDPDRVDNLVFTSFITTNMKKHILFTVMLGMHFGNQGAFSISEMKSSASEIEKLPVPDFVISFLSRPFFQADIPVLRAFYPLLKQLPEILRYDPANQTWYFSRY